MQYYSFILVEQEDIRNKLITICGGQTGAKEAPVLIVFCADINKMSKQANFLKLDHCLKHGYGLSEKFFAIFDACFAAQNMVIAAESFGLGSVMLGDPFDNIYETAKALKLPPGVLPISTLCIGYPDEDPPRRSRWPLDCVLFKNEYREISESEIETYLKNNKKERSRISEILDLDFHKDTEPSLIKDLKIIGFFSFSSSPQHTQDN